MSTIDQAVPPHHSEIKNFDTGGGQTPERLRRYRLGLALFVSSIAMLFVGFSSAYVVRRGVPAYDVASGSYSLAWEPLQLPIRLLLTNTLLLVVASFAAEFARRSAASAYLSRTVHNLPDLRWTCASTLLALGFITGQVFAWSHLYADGHRISSGARTAFFYVITAAHAFHAVLGVLLLAWILFRARLWSLARRYMATDLSSWYLHSMTALWIYLFCFLVFA
jgi:cytochrome c oxidase subunit 3